MSNFPEELNRAKVASTSNISTIPPVNHVARPSHIDEAAFSPAIEFGRDLILTQDLDPVYTAIHGAGLDYDTLARLLLAYSCLYHLVRRAMR